MPLPITSAQQLALRKLRKTHPPIGSLAIDVASAFDETKIDNPEFARVILETLCRRLVAGEPSAVESLMIHFETLGQLGCIEQGLVASFIKRIQELPMRMPTVQLPAAG